MLLPAGGNVKVHPDCFHMIHKGDGALYFIDGPAVTVNLVDAEVKLVLEKNTFLP